MERDSIDENSAFEMLRSAHAQPQPAVAVGRLGRRRRVANRREPIGRRKPIKIGPTEFSTETEIRAAGVHSR